MNQENRENIDKKEEELSKKIFKEIRLLLSLPIYVSFFILLLLVIHAFITLFGGF